MLNRTLREIQDKASTKEGFKCEIENCKNPPNSIVMGDEMILVCKDHRKNTDVTIRYYNHIWRVWELP